VISVKVSELYTKKDAQHPNSEDHAAAETGFKVCTAYRAYHPELHEASKIFSIAAPRSCKPYWRLYNLAEKVRR
jgi:hypothetical protein